MDRMNAIANVFTQPPIPFEPERQSLKAWAMYCLRDRGFKVVYAQNADFAIEPRTGDKLYFSVTQTTDSLNPEMNWIARDPATNSITVIPASS